MARVMCGGCKSMKTPARKDKRVIIQQLKSSLTPDAAGHVDKVSAASWETALTRWASVITKGSREFERLNIVATEATHVWELPSDSGTRALTEKNRISWNSRIFDIKGIQDVNEDKRVVMVETVEHN